MYHRICNELKLGNPEEAILINNCQLPRYDGWEIFVDDLSCILGIPSYGFDYRLEDNYFFVGTEPTYMYDKLAIVKIDFTNIGNCEIIKGISFGEYGTNVVSKTRAYKEYKRKSKFIRFIDKWHPKLKMLFNK